MNNSILELQSNIDLLNEIISTEYSAIKSKLSEVFNEYIVDSDDVRIKFQIRTEDSSGITVSGTIGFFNLEENKVDFNSDFTFEFVSSRGTFEVNPGTCGYWGKKDTYQVRRVTLLAKLFNNIDAVEQDLGEVCKSEHVEKYVEYVNTRWENMRKLEKIKEDITLKEKQALVNSLEVGDILTYDDSVGAKFRKFNSNGDVWRILRISDKTIKVSSEHLGSVQLNKSYLEDLLYRKLIIIKKENE